MKAIITKSIFDIFSIDTYDERPCLKAKGKTIEEAKAEFLKEIDRLKRLFQEHNQPVPEHLFENIEYIKVGF